MSSHSISRRQLVRQVKSLKVVFLKLSGCLLAMIVFASPAQAQEAIPRHVEMEYLSYAELVQLSNEPYPEGELKENLERFWRQAEIDNTAYLSGSKPRELEDPFLGKYLRLATWNIEKSIEMPEAIKLWTAETDVFQSMLDLKKAPVGSKLAQKASQQRGRLILADVIVLQEMEIGIKRSGYLHAARELAQSLGMNYAYAPQYLEVDPVILGQEMVHYNDGKTDAEASDYYRVDPEKYKGVFGSAVLSRYPIKHVELRQLYYQPYDWYFSERKKVGFLEHGRRLGGKTIFQNEITREMKVGGRNYFRVDLEVPDLPENTLSIINIHLEIKCKPKERERQMIEILHEIQKISHPVIMVGDFNASPVDISAISASKLAKEGIKNPTNWLSGAVNYLTPNGLILNTTRGLSNITKNLNNPLATNVKVLAPNPLKPLFKRIQKFRFRDGGYFDFRGDEERSIGGKKGDLANSNQRGTKGFITSFSVRRPWGVIGRFRLDWVFVKSYLREGDEPLQYQFAPHFAETMQAMSEALKVSISDHYPSVVDLPFKEPSQPAV